MEQGDLDNRFRFHEKSRVDNAQAHSTVRNEAGRLAGIFNSLLPEGREKSLAVTKVEEAVFWANAAIARSS